MDKYYEQLVKRVPQKNDHMKEILVWLGAVAGTAAVFYIMIILLRPKGEGTFDLTTNYTVFLLSGSFLFMQAALFSKRLKLEYEYTFIENEIKVDRIMPNGGRRSLACATFGQLIAFGRYNDSVRKKYSKYKNKPYNIYRAYAKAESELWYMVYLDNGRKKMAIIEPDAKTLGLIRDALPSELRKAAFEL